MLVLKRRQNESVVIGDEITLTVEEICGSDDGRRIFGASVQLGFQSPRYVSVYRSELRARSSATTHRGGKAKPARPTAGSLVEISGAQVRLRIQVPPKIPVCCSGTPTVELDSQQRQKGATDTPNTVHRLSCHKEDRITICHNITIAVLKFHRFVSRENPQNVLARFVGAGGSCPATGLSAPEPGAVVHRSPK